MFPRFRFTLEGMVQLHVGLFPISLFTISVWDEKTLEGNVFFRASLLKDTRLDKPDTLISTRARCTLKGRSYIPALHSRLLLDSYASLF